MMMIDFVIVGICRQVMIDMRIHDNDAFFRNQLTEFSTETLSRLSTVLHTGKKLKFFIFEYRLSTIMIFNAQGAQLPRRGRPGYTTGSTATSFILLIIVAKSDMFRCKRCLATSTTTSRWLPRTCGGWTSSTERPLARCPPRTLNITFITTITLHHDDNQAHYLRCGTQSTAKCA